MHQIIDLSEAAESRAALRTHLFVAATMHAAGVATPVKIRDLSPDGAQIESPLIPEVGALMRLTRGALSVKGHVTWTAERRCGVRFEARISVREWMANPVNRSQRRVDYVVAAVKAGAVPRALAEDAVAGEAQGTADDLDMASRLLAMLGDALANDAVTITRHSVVLQNLDIAGQTLTALAAMMRSGQPCAASSARLRELRASCAGAFPTKL